MEKGIITSGYDCEDVLAYFIFVPDPVTLNALTADGEQLISTNTSNLS